MTQPVTVMSHASLTCVDPTINASKVYHVQLIATDGGFQVVAQYGRIGGHLTDTAKSDAHIAYARARELYEALVEAKRREYTDDAPLVPDVARYESGYHIVNKDTEFEAIIRTHRPPQIDDPTKVMRAERAQRKVQAHAKDLATTIARLIDDASVAPASMAAQYVTIHKNGGTIRLEGVEDVRTRELARRAALEIGGSFVGYGYCADPVFVLIKADRKLDELLARTRPQIVRAGIAPEGLRSAKCAVLSALFEGAPEASAAFEGIGESARISRDELVAALPYLDVTRYPICAGVDDERTA